MKNLLAILLIFSSLQSSAYHNRHPEHITLHGASERESKKYKTNDLFKSFLELSSFRNRILSENIAHANTPGYKANEVAIPSAYDDLAGKGKVSRKIRMDRTSSTHLGGSQGAEGKFSSHKLKNPHEIKKNGNNVSITQQMTKLSQNKNDYVAAVKAYATANSLYSTALGK